MPRRSRCHKVDAHCRKLSGGQKAKHSCTKNGARGTMVKRFYSPKSTCNSAHARIAAAARARASRNKKKKKPASPKAIRTSNRPNKGVPRQRLIQVK